MSLSKKLLFTAIVLVAGGFALAHWMRPVAVVEPVIRGKAVLAVPASITVMPERTLPIVSEVGGRILGDNYNLDPGQQVRMGEVLAQLDTQTLRLEIERIQIDLAASRRAREIGIPKEQELENARAVLARNERDAASGNLSAAEVDAQRRVVRGLEQEIALLRSAENQLINAYENTLALRQRQLEAMTIKAPLTGQISEVFVNEGQFIGDRHEMATLITATRTIEARVSEENFAGISIGQFASVRFLTYGLETFRGTVSKILPTADAATQRYILHLNVDIDPSRLRPGITGEASIVLGDRENTLIIPRRAMLGDSVLVVEDGRVAIRRVTPGYSSLNEVEILEGIAEGELVIVERLDEFREGDRVSVVNASELN